MIETRAPNLRLNILKILLYATAFVFTVKIVDFQIFKYSYYRDIAEKNKTQIIAQSAPRGRILTADGVVVASNKPSFTLVYFPIFKKRSLNPDEMTKAVSRHIKISAKEIKKKIYSSIKRNIPVKIADSLSDKLMFSLSELRTFYPGLNIISEAQRFYPGENFLSHLIGYMGKITAEDWKFLRNENYSMDSYIGKSGIEKRFEKELKGTDGGVYLEVDSKGRLIQILESRQSSRGADIRLTVNSRIQKAAEDGLKESLSGRGAVVALNPRNGAVLAIASFPNFNPNIMTSGNGQSDIPEFNLATQGTFPPASVFKIIVSAAGLELGKINLKRKIYCPGYFDAGSRVFKCWKKKGHGRVSFYGGFAQSCDVYFYNMGIEIGPYNMAKFAGLFGFGQTTNLSVKSESSGNIFGPSKRAAKKKYWFIGDTLNLSIGQGETLVTPIQMAQLAAIVANGGKIWKPYYVSEITDKRGYKIFSQSPRLLSQIKLKNETWNELRKAMREVVDAPKGTGYAARIKGVKVFGKTGSAQNPHGDDHAWFVSYAQFENEKPEIAVCVLVAFGKHGASSAAPIARKVMEAALKDKIEKREIELKKEQEGRDRG